MSDASKRSQDLVTEWVNSERALEMSRSEVNAAEIRLLNAARALGRHIAPDDAAIGEVIAIWVRIDPKRERLIVVTKGRGDSDFRLAFRGSPREREGASLPDDETDAQEETRRG